MEVSGRSRLGPQREHHEMFQKFLIKSNAKGIEKAIFNHDMKSE